jgi:hypothetical protein
VPISVLVGRLFQAALLLTVGKDEHRNGRKAENQEHSPALPPSLAQHSLESGIHGAEH